MGSRLAPVRRHRNRRILAGPYPGLDIAAVEIDGDTVAVDADVGTVRVDIGAHAIEVDVDSAFVRRRAVATGGIRGLVVRRGPGFNGASSDRQRSQAKTRNQEESAHPFLLSDLANAGATGAVPHRRPGRARWPSAPPRPRL